MPFDLASATPVSSGGGFDLASATPESSGPPDATKLKIPGQSDDMGTGKPAPRMSMLDAPRGALEAGISAGSSMLAGPIGGAAGALRALTGGNFGTQAGVEQGARTASDVSRALTYQPQSQPGQQVLGAVSSAFDASKLAGLNPSQGMAIGLSRPPASAIPKAVAGSTEGFAIGQGLKKAGAAMRPEIDPQVAELARKAEGMGIKVTPDMLSDNRVLRIIGQASRDVPLSGSPAKGNREAFNRMVIKAFGGDDKATKITPAVFERAMNEHGETIGKISEKYPIPYTPDFQQRISRISANQMPAIRDVLNSYAADMADMGRNMQQIKGTQFRQLRSKVTAQMRRTSDGDLKHALSQLDDEMLNAIQAQLSPEELESFNQARTHYANGKTVEPLIAKAATKGSGDMSPAALAGRVTASSSGKSAAARGKAGDLADVSAVGNRFMTEPGSSLTAERALAYGMLGDIGTLLKVAGMYIPANIYNRFGPRVAQGMLPPPPPNP